VATLIDSIRQAGLECELLTVGDPIDLTPGVDLVAYRVIEVALLTAAEHRVSRGLVTIRYEPRELKLEIAGDGAIPDLDESVRSIAQRVALYDGSLRALPTRGGGFTLHARPPLEAAVPA
jgi:signal transduction histidine kinase